MKSRCVSGVRMVGMNRCLRLVCHGSRLTGAAGCLASRQRRGVRNGKGIVGLVGDGGLRRGGLLAQGYGRVAIAVTLYLQGRAACCN